MKIIFSFLIFISSLNLKAEIEIFNHNFFNFYRKPSTLYFKINSNNGTIGISLYHEYYSAKRTVTPFNGNENIYVYGDSSYGEPLSHQKLDSAKGIIKPIGIEITYDPPRKGIHGKGDVYLMMFRLNPDSSRNYGWLKFNISADCDSLYFISSGFNTIINDPVVAGEGEWDLSKPFFNPNFKLYPNPSSAFQLEIPDSYFNSNIFIEIMDLNGKIIHNNPYQNQPFSLPIPNGLYWVIIKNENEILSQIRWIKE